MHSRDAAHMLDRYALLLEIAGENPFKARAFAAAAEMLAQHDQSLHDLIESGSLHHVRGIGEGILAVLEELDRTGTISHLAALEQQIPPGVIQLTELRGVGPKKARQLWLDYGITSIEQLERACQEQRVATWKGFSAKTQAALLEAIAFWRSTRGRIQRHKAWRYVRALQEVLQQHGAMQVFAAGPLRRGAEVIEEIVLVAVVLNPSTFQPPEGFQAAGSFRYRHLTADVPITLIVSEPESAGTALFFATGSEEFIAAAVASMPVPPLPREEDVFAALNLPFIPPELRNDAAIVQQVRAGASLPSLITLGDMRGMIHVHTTWSDGQNTIEEMALHARQLGFEYIVICDHSQSAAYAGGLTVERVLQQKAEIEALNKRLQGITILHGIESDILPDGSLDYPDEVLIHFDVVVASVHTHFNLSRHEQTARILRAIANPYTTILGHPTGRLLLRRSGYDVDLDAILAEAARTGTVIEFNVNPYRLDLDWRHHRTATAKGVRFAIDPDAHSIEGMAEITDGITVARRGGLTAADVVNTLSLEQFRAFTTQLRHSKHHRVSAL
ncbi:MAG: PHP domain-containing protein [Bacteroidota bacterium]|nr:PHP domain-containing protein [Candidatus Kapabacteria bacterium]MDW8272179.1 PHP domain-containing protein [Bacteroidota bacterium]